MYTIKEGDLDNNCFIKLARVTIIVYLLVHEELNSYFFMFRCHGFQNLHLTQIEC